MDPFHEYLRVMWRTLKLWQGYFDQSQEWDRQGIHSTGVVSVGRLIRSFQYELDAWGENLEQPISQSAIWGDIDKTLHDLHTQIHTLPNREPYHRKIRVLEELLRQVRLELSKPLQKICDPPLI